MTFSYAKQLKDKIALLLLIFALWKIQFRKKIEKCTKEEKIFLNLKKRSPSDWNSETQA